jgi:LmbE family N-acetylglucosaminyl deacetylase
MKILGIGSHPDDLEYGCGGLFCRLVNKGHSVHMLVMTGGEEGGNPRLRRKEQESCVKMVGAKLYWGGFRDTEIPDSRALIEVVEKFIVQVKPDIILSHYWDDTHQDHRRLAYAVITASRYVRDLLLYEVPSTRNFSPQVFVDIGPVVKRKYELLRGHASQINKTHVPYLSILESAKSAAIYRGHQAHVKYAEAFLPYRLMLDAALHL